MRKILVLFLFFAVFWSSVTALDFDIRDECSGEYPEEMFSISNRTNAHAAEPYHYDGFVDETNNREGKEVCATDELSTRIDTECDYMRNPIFSFYDAGSSSAHLSAEGDRNDYVLCAQKLSTSVRQECPGGSVPIVSIYDSVENHVAEPGYYDWQICGQLFENATLAYNFTMEGNTDFVQDGEIIGDEETEQTSSTDDESYYPLYSTVQNDTLISGIVGTDTHPQETTIQLQDDTAAIEHFYGGSGSARWFLPLTTGSYFDIEDRLSLIAENNFLTQFNPNFAFVLAEEIMVRITLEVMDTDIVNDLRLGSGNHNLVIENVGEEDRVPQVRINETTE